MNLPLYIRPVSWNYPVQISDSWIYPTNARKSRIMSFEVGALHDSVAAILWLTALESAKQSRTHVIKKRERQKLSIICGGDTSDDEEAATSCAFFVNARRTFVPIPILIGSDGESSELDSGYQASCQSMYEATTTPIISDLLYHHEYLVHFARALKKELNCSCTR